MASAGALAESSGRHQFGQIKNDTSGESCGRLCEFISCAAAACGFFRRECKFAEHAELAEAQDKAALEEIIAAMQEVRGPEPKAQSPSPILVKVAPDLSFEALDDIVELALARGLAGIVATNTTISRPGTKDEKTQRVYVETDRKS